MRVSQILCVVAVVAAGWTWAPAVAQAQTPSAFLAVEKVTPDPAASNTRVTVRNVGQQKVTGCALLVGAQQFTQEFFYSIGMDQKQPIRRQAGSGRVSVGVDAKQTVPRPVGLGGIAPGDLVELLFPSGQDGAVTAEVNAVILEDGTAVGDEAQIASMFSHRLAYSSEWARWALVMQEDPSQTGSPAAGDAERAEIIRSLQEDPNDRGDAATVAGRMAARKALGSLLAQVTEANRAAPLEYVQERAASLRLHAQREGGIAAVPAAITRNATLKPETSEVRMDPFTCRSPGQLLGIAGYADVFGGTAQGDSAAKVGTLSAVATGVCAAAGSPVAATSVPACRPEFFTTTSPSPSSATITGVTYSYVPALGCTILGSQAATMPASATTTERETAQFCAEAALNCTSTVRGGNATCTVTPSDVTVSNWRFTGGGATVTRTTNTGSLTWSGRMATGGTVSVDVTDGNNETATMSASITVTARGGFAFTAVSPTYRSGNSYTGDNCNISVPSYPSSGNDLGYMCVKPAFSFVPSEAISDNGPNHGFRYVVSASDSYQNQSTVFNYIVATYVDDAYSEFSSYQCGTYSTDPNGYISQPTLLLNILEHEAGMLTGHYAQYRAANGSNNVGVALETEVGRPDVDYQGFMDQVQNAGITKANEVGTAASAEACNRYANIDTACAFCGYINWPTYQSCVQ